MVKLSFTSLIFCMAALAYGQNLAEKQWIEDIECYKNNLEKYHIDLYHSISKKEFEQGIAQIKSDVQNKNEVEIILDLMRLTRKIQDGHTALSLRGMQTHQFPIELYKVNGQWRVIKTTVAHQSLLGNALIKIEGKPIEQIEKEVSAVAQYVENAQSETIRTGNYMVLSEVLAGLQIIQQMQQATFTFMDDANGTSDITLQAIPKSRYYQNTAFEYYKIDTPGISKPADAKHDFLWYSPIANTKAVYIKFESYPSFEEMEAFGESVLEFMNQNESKQVIIDLRNNGGGDFFVGTFLAYYLNLANSIDWNSGVYALVDKVTFSAATINAAQFKQILHAKIVGEPTGSNPNGPQDMGQFSLPNSGITITYSKRFFRFQDKPSQGLQPDVLLQYDWQSYVEGKDSMLEWVINELNQQLD